MCCSSKQCLDDSQIKFLRLKKKKEGKKIVFDLVLIDSLTHAGGLRDEGQIELIVPNRAGNKNQQKVTHKKSLLFGGCFFPWPSCSLFKGICAFSGMPSE